MNHRTVAKGKQGKCAEPDLKAKEVGSEGPAVRKLGAPERGEEWKRLGEELWKAAERLDRTGIERLLKAGADLSAALYFVCVIASKHKGARPDAVELLFEYGADANDWH